MADAAVLEAEEEHDSSPYDCDASQPVNGLHTRQKCCFWCFDVKKVKNDSKGDPIKGH